MEAFNSSQDNIYQLAHILRGLRNKKQENRRDRVLDPSIPSMDFYAKILVSKEKNYFIQVATIFKDNELRAEIPIIHPDFAMFTRENRKWLTKNEWLVLGKESTGYSKSLDVGSEKDLYLSTTDLVTTLIELYNFVPSDPLNIETGEAENIRDFKTLSIGLKAKFYLKCWLSVLSEKINV